MYGSGKSDFIRERVRACDYLVVAQLFLQQNFLLEHPLKFEDIKPRLLGHWGTCHGIDVVYANLKAYFPHIDFILGPGHGFPALQANLFLDGTIEKYDKNATRDEKGIAYICREFSWPGGFPSHASPFTPGVICEGGELGYALATAYGSVLGHPEKTVAVLIGDGELETATALSSMNLNKLFGENVSINGKVIPILHLNGYKISAPTISARKSERELAEQIRGFGYTPIFANEKNFGQKLQELLNPQYRAVAKRTQNPFIVFRSEKGATGPEYLDGQKIAGNYLAHQIPLKNAKTSEKELKMLENWLKSYHFNELFSKETGFAKGVFL